MIRREDSTRFDRFRNVQELTLNDHGPQIVSKMDQDHEFTLTPCAADSYAWVNLLWYDHDLVSLLTQGVSLIKMA